MQLSFFHPINLSPNHDRVGSRPHGCSNQQIYKLTPTDSKTLAVADVLYFLSQAKHRVWSVLQEPGITRGQGLVVKVAGGGSVSPGPGFHQPGELVARERGAKYFDIAHIGPGPLLGTRYDM